MKGRPGAIGHFRGLSLLKSGFSLGVAPAKRSMSKILKRE
jgi:hypothetical protein